MENSVCSWKQGDVRRHCCISFRGSHIGSIPLSNPSSSKILIQVLNISRFIESLQNLCVLFVYPDTECLAKGTKRIMNMFTYFIASFK